MNADPKQLSCKPLAVGARDRTWPGGPGLEVLEAAAREATSIRGRARAGHGGRASRLVVVSGPRRGSECPLGAGEIGIGRGSACAVIIADLAASRRHALVRRESGAYVLVDQCSGNGTRVNGRLVARHVLRQGDEIAIAGTTLRFVDGEAAPAPEGEASLSGLRTRASIYGLALSVLSAATGAGLWARHRRDLAAADAAHRAEETRSIARRHLGEAQRLLGEGRWAEARQQFSLAAELDSQNAEIARAFARAEAEAPRAQALEAARAALARREFATARDALAAVRDDSALAGAAHQLQAALRDALESSVREARARAQAGDAAGAAALIQPVLAVDPGREDALEVQRALRSRLPGRARGQRRAAPSPGSAGPPQDGGRAPPSPIVAAYLSGDVAGALLRAQAAKDGRSRQLARDLQDFAAAWRDGRAKARVGRKAEAIAALEIAETLDKDIAEAGAAAVSGSGPSRAAEAWKGSRPGAEVRQALSILHAALGLAAVGSGSDDALPAAAAHLRAALEFDPQDQEARAGLFRASARAKEIYLRGYVAKDGEPQAARRDFEVVRGTLPEGDETAQKAKRWLDRLDGKAPPENG
jgi:hypothetical protein